MQQGDMRLNRKTWHRIGAGLAAGLVPLLLAAPVRGQVAYPNAEASASATGTVVHAGLLQSGDTRLVDGEVGFTGAAFDSRGLVAPSYNEVRRQFAPASAGKTAYARGSAVEAGLAVTPDTDNQVILAGKAEADAPEPMGPVTKEVGPLDLGPLAWANLLRGRASAGAIDGACALGTDLSHGSAYVADVQLLDTAAAPASTPSSASQPTAPSASPESSEQPSSGLGGTLNSLTKPVTDVVSSVTSEAPAPVPVPAAAQRVPNEPAEGLSKPLIALDADDPTRAVSQSRSRTLFVAQRNAAGELLGSDFGLMSEVRQTIAPVTLFRGTANELTIEFLGEWVLQAVATGIGGAAYIHYGPGEISPDTPVLRLIDSDGVQTLLRLQDIFGDQGFVLEIPGVAEVAIGEDPRAIGGSATSDPSVAGDGTSVSAAVDVVRVRALPGEPELADVRVGHMEVRAQVPAGGVSCPIPVTKTPSAQTVDVGDEFSTTFDITNPYDCTLEDVSLTDDITTEDEARFEVVSTDPEATDVPQGSGLSSETIRWSDLGDVPPGGHLTVTATFKAAGGAGAIVDKATASAPLSDCAQAGGTVGGVDVSVTGSKMHGDSAEVSVGVIETEVAAAISVPGELPRTGAPIELILTIAVALLAAGTAGLTLVYRVRYRMR